MPPEVLRLLRCPVCTATLTETGSGRARALRCGAGHAFDVARHGYVYLGGPRIRHTGDSASMVAARAEFLGRGHYDFVHDAVLQSIARQPVAPGIDGALIVEGGAGTARHLAALLHAWPRAFGLALDVSKPALRRAARAHPRLGAALADTTGRWPLADGAATVLLNAFAPRNGSEFRRVLRDDGALFVVTPTAQHLHELADAIGMISVDGSKSKRLEASLRQSFELQAESDLERVLTLTREEARAAVAMGPSARHIDPASLDARVAGLPQRVRVTVALRVGRYRPRLPATV